MKHEQILATLDGCGTAIVLDAVVAILDEYIDKLADVFETILDGAD
jgi:hypothetical protein